MKKWHTTSHNLLHGIVVENGIILEYLIIFKKNKNKTENPKGTSPSITRREWQEGGPFGITRGNPDCHKVGQRVGLSSTNRIK